MQRARPPLNAAGIRSGLSRRHGDPGGYLDTEKQARSQQPGRLLWEARSQQPGRLLWEAMSQQPGRLLWEARIAFTWFISPCMH